MSRERSRPVLVTGAAGFTGAALCQRLLERGDRVVGLDNLNSYYDPALKRARLAELEDVAAIPGGAGTWCFKAIALEDADALMGFPRFCGQWLKQLSC